MKLINVEKDQSEIRVFCELEFLHFRITEAAPEDEDRIVGGHEVSPPHKYPFQVKKVHLKLSNENTYIPGVFCFWTLCLCWFRFRNFILSINLFLVRTKKCIILVLDRHHILTAAHCVYDPETGNLQVGIDTRIQASDLVFTLLNNYES